MGDIVAARTLENTNTNSKDHVCNFCGKKTADMSGLMQHQRQSKKCIRIRKIIEDSFFVV